MFKAQTSSFTSSSYISLYLFGILYDGFALGNRPSLRGYADRMSWGSWACKARPARSQVCPPPAIICRILHQSQCKRLGRVKRVPVRQYGYCNSVHHQDRNFIATVYEPLFRETFTANFGRYGWMANLWNRSITFCHPEPFPL